MVRGSTLPRTSGSDREQAAKITTDAVKTTAEITRNGTIKHFGAKPKERTDTKVVGILRIPNRRSRVAVTNGLCEYPPRDHGSLSQPPPAIPYFILSQGTNTRIHFDRIHFESSPFPVSIRAELSMAFPFLLRSHRIHYRRNIRCLSDLTASFLEFRCSEK